MGLDTSVLLRLLVGEPIEQAESALAFLVEFTDRGGALHVTDLVICETYYALQYHYGATKREALDALRRFLNESSIEASGHARSILQTPRLASRKPGFVDRLIHAAYTAESAGMVTFEKKAGILENVEVLD